MFSTNRDHILGKGSCSIDSYYPITTHVHVHKCIGSPVPNSILKLQKGTNSKSVKLSSIELKQQKLFHR